MSSSSKPYNKIHKISIYKKWIRLYVPDLKTAKDILQILATKITIVTDVGNLADCDPEAIDNILYMDSTHEITAEMLERIKKVAKDQNSKAYLLTSSKSDEKDLRIELNVLIPAITIHENGRIFSFYKGDSSANNKKDLIEKTNNLLKAVFNCTENCEHCKKNIDKTQYDDDIEEFNIPVVEI